MRERKGMGLDGTRGGGNWKEYREKILKSGYYLCEEKLTLQATAISLVLLLFFQKVSSLFYLASCFKKMGNIVRQINFMSMNPMSHMSYCEVSFLVISNVAWKTKRTAKAFCESIAFQLNLRQNFKRKSKSYYILCYNITIVVSNKVVKIYPL